MESIIAAIASLLADPQIGLVVLMALIILAAIVVVGMSVYGMTLAIKFRKDKK